MKYPGASSSCCASAIYRQVGFGRRSAGGKDEAEDKVSVLDEVNEDIDRAIECSEKTGEVAGTF